MHSSGQTFTSYGISYLLLQPKPKEMGISREIIIGNVDPNFLCSIWWVIPNYCSIYKVLTPFTFKPAGADTRYPIYLCSGNYTRLPTQFLFLSLTCFRGKTCNIISSSLHIQLDSWQLSVVLRATTLNQTFNLMIAHRFYELKLLIGTSCWL